MNPYESAFVIPRVVLFGAGGTVRFLSTLARVFGYNRSLVGNTFAATPGGCRRDKKICLAKMRFSRGVFTRGESPKCHILGRFRRQTRETPLTITTAVDIISKV